jgi:predicted regulator of Ras-like GTPase activity (Roadblock/LC7/MglB family)
MQDILKDINAVVGVTGSFVCNGEGQILASALPELFDETILSAVGRTMAEVATARRREIGDIDLVYDQGRLIAKNLGEGYLCILCVRHINVPLLNLTANVAAKKLGEMGTALQKAVTGGPTMTAAISLEDEGRRRQEKLAALYAEAVGFLKVEEWQQALEKWVEVQSIDRAYPDPQEVVAKAKRGLAKLEAAVSPVEPVPPVKEETVPIWRRVPVWIWAAIGAAILLVNVGAGAALPVSPTAGSQLPAVLSPTSTPVPATPTPTPTAAVAATQTALASLAADVMATALAQASAAVGTSIPTPTDTPTPTQTPVPPTATATHTLTPPTLTPTPTAVPQPALTIYLRNTRTETGFAALNGDQPNGGMIYKEGKFVYGDAAVQIGDTVYHFDKPEIVPGEPEQLPDPWQVEFEFAEELVAHTENQAGFNPKQAQFWVGPLDGDSAVGEDNPYSLMMSLYEGTELRESIQVFFTVADALEGSGGEGGASEGGGGGEEAGKGKGRGKDKNKDKGKG